MLLPSIPSFGAWFTVIGWCCVWEVEDGNSMCVNVRGVLCLLPGARVRLDAIRRRSDAFPFYLCPPSFEGMFH